MAENTTVQDGGESTSTTNDDRSVDTLKNQFKELQSDFENYKETQKEVRKSIEGKVVKRVSTQWESDLKEIFGIDDDLKGDDLKQALLNIRAGKKSDNDNNNDETTKIVDEYNRKLEEMSKLVEAKENELKSFVEKQKQERKTSKIKTMANLILSNGYELSKDNTANETKLNASINEVLKHRYSDDEQPVLLDDEGTPVYVDGKKQYLKDVLEKSINVFFNKKEAQQNNLDFIGRSSNTTVTENSIAELQAKLKNPHISLEEYQKTVDILEKKQRELTQSQNS